MCECILSDTLEGKIHVNTLLKWLSNQHTQHDNFSEIESSKCFQGDFISFFLNYVHDVQTYIDKSSDNVQKAVTPKRIERVKLCGEATKFAGPVVRRRSALFENIDSNRQIDVEHPTNFSHSTPKIVRNNLDESYASPLSPLYDRQNFNASKERFYTQPSPTLCLGDFITRGKSSAKKKAQRSLNENLVMSSEDNHVKARRINPTSLTQRRFNGANFRNDNSFTFKNDADEVVDSCSEQRSYLVEERIKIMSKRNVFESVPAVTVMKTLVMNRKKEIVPLFRLVTSKEQLDVLVVMYNFMLDNNFVLNLTSELYFLVSVLLGREYEDDVSPNNSLNLGVAPLPDFDNEESKFPICTLFGTIHNRVYFASKIFQSQTIILKILDRTTLRLLLENKRLQQFTTSQFYSNLLLIQKQKVEKTAEPSEAVQTNVCFISDTDNRDNFPTDPSFHAFRKQRDLFYETLRIWENNRLQDEWNFMVALGGKIKALLNMYADAANLVHFARLFKAQLLMSTCGRSEEDNIVVGENQLSFLSSIPNIDAEKLLRLKSRIVSKQTSSSVNSVPAFTGYQEFYRDFLLVASNHMFNKHLNDALVSEIIDLNNTKFSFSDFDDTDALVDSTIQNSYVLAVKSLRILAKFLGFLESLPYKSDCVQLPQNVVACQIRIRSELQPNVNLKDVLKNSIKNNGLILTIPWVTEYLAMLDYVTLRLPYFQDFFHMLFEVYCFCCSDTNGKSVKFAGSCMSVQNTFLVRLCLGWLFELPHFPGDSFYVWLSQKLSVKLKCSTLKIVSPDNKKGQRKVQKTPCLDELDMVDQSVLYVCCPYLQEIKKLLSNDASAANNANVTMKHITPLTAVQSPTDVSNKRIQLQLEEAFFNGQPVSIRKTVEFISERVASACIKQICNDIVPAYKKKALAELKEMLNSYDLSNLSEDESARLRLTVNSKTSKFAASSLEKLRLQIEDELIPMANIRIRDGVEALVAADILKQTKDVCVTIAVRTCLERMQQWISSHVNLGIFTKDFDGEVRHLFLNHGSRHIKAKPVFALPLLGKNIKHNLSALSGVKIVENIRNYCWRVLEQPKSVMTAMVVDLLDSVYLSIKERCDLNEWILILINRMLVDLSLLLVAHCPPVLLEEIITTKLCLIWRESGCNIDDLFKTIICPRNIMILIQSADVNASWKSLRDFTTMLLKEKLLSCDIFETQVVSFDKNILNEVILRDFYSCLRGVVDDYVSMNGSQGVFTGLLSFLSD